MQEELKYKVTVDGDTGSAQGIKQEIESVDDTLGDKIPKASKKAHSAYQEFIENAKKSTYELHEPIKLFHRLLGTLTFVVGPLILLWEYYSQRQERVAKAVSEARDKHIDLIRTLEDEERAGIRLTEVQKKLKDALEDQSKREGQKLIDNLKERNKAIEENIKSTTALRDAQSSIMPSGQTLITPEDKQRIEAYNAQLSTMNLELRQNEAQIQATAKGHKTLEDQLAREQQARANAIATLRIQSAARQQSAQTDAEIAKMADNDILNSAYSTGEQKARVIESAEARELAAVDQGAIDKKAILDAEKIDEMGGEQLHAAKILALIQETEDKKRKIRGVAAEARKAIGTEEVNKVKQEVQQMGQAFLAGFNQKIKQTHDLGEAIKAGADASVDIAVQEAQKQSVIWAISAAQKSYAWAAAFGGPVAGGIAAAAAFAGVMSIGAAIGAGGAALSSALGGGGSTGSGSAGGGNGPLSTTDGGIFSSGSSSGRHYIINISGLDMMKTKVAARYLLEEIRRLEAS